MLKEILQKQEKIPNIIYRYEVLYYFLDIVFEVKTDLTPCNCILSNMIPLTHNLIIQNILNSMGNKKLIQIIKTQ